MVERHSRPSPESAKDLTRRRTEIYMSNEDLTEHIKLRQHADHELNPIDKLRHESEERTNRPRLSPRVARTTVSRLRRTQPTANAQRSLGGRKFSQGPFLPRFQNLFNGPQDDVSELMRDFTF